MSFDPARPPLTVRPRKPYKANLPLIAVASDGSLVEETGEVGVPIVERLRELAPALILCEHPDRFLAQAQAHYRAAPDWNWRVIPAERQIGYGELAQIRQELLIAYCGFRRGKRTHYFYPIGPAQYGRHTLNELGRETEPKYVTLYRWGKYLRQWCNEQQLKVTSTSGGIAAQLLRDKRFYPRSRRKVPMATNERVRPYLPGNHYELAAKEGLVYGAAYVIDQHGAHHQAAINARVPDSNGLYVRGHWRNPDSERRWASIEDMAGLYGLVKIWAHIPEQVAHDRWIPKNLSRDGRQAIYLYTNEIEFARKLGVDLQHVVAAWVSEKADEGIRHYAEWALNESRRKPRWLKGTLLSAYGILGARPKKLSSCYWASKHGDDFQIWLEAELTNVKLVQTEFTRQTPIAHLIQRGIIEAETRRRSLTLARGFRARRVTVYAVQADAVIIDGTTTQLPLLPQPWRVKERLGWVRFDNLQIHSGEQVGISVQSHYPKEAA